MHILPKGWIHPFRLHICHFCSSFSQFWNSLPKILFWKISLIILCVFVFLWNLRQTLESCNKTKRQQWLMCFVENIYLYFQGRVLGYGEAVLLTASLLFSFCPAPRLILWFPSRFSSTVFFFLNWGCSNLIHLPRCPKKLNIMIKVGSVLTPCMIGFRLRESIWAYMIYALNVILWRFCIMLLFQWKFHVYCVATSIIALFSLR